MIVIGIDPHKSSHTATAVDSGGERLGTIRASSTSARRALLTWAAQWPQRRWAIEGATGLGKHLAQQLVSNGELVVDVPASLTANARFLQPGHGRKTDQIDATAVAVVALNRKLQVVAGESDAELFRLLSDRRDDLTCERRRTINRLHRHLRDLIPGGAPTGLSADAAAKLLIKVRPVGLVQTERKAVARELLADVRRLDKALKNNQKRCHEAVTTSDSRVTDIYGIGDVLAVKILGHVADISRFPSSDHFASYAGTAPIEASSGDTIRHRLSRAGNRQLNSAIHLAAHVQTMRPGPGRDYYLKKLSEGKSPAKAKRALKRQVTKSIYRAMQPPKQAAIPLAA